ncbi:hypothetical protein ACE38V_15710 [Cytobacillus sp. Hz8]|uniref:hypothetical protein n=1 Tax=Cytobacillus sp. Hz8 TaxID=3347168 RepID=UPI0035E1A6B2
MEKIVFSFLITGFLLVGLNLTKAEAAIDNKPGDIIITKSTSSSGITGHAGIYIGKITILHTSGRSTEPYPKTISEISWHNRYGQSKVIRPKSSTLGQNAANMAVKYFKGKKIPFSIKDAVTKRNKDITKTYCSELVYYSYYKAGLELKVKSLYSPIWGKLKGLVQPYVYTNKDIVSHNNYKFIDNKW